MNFLKKELEQGKHTSFAQLACSLHYLGVRYPHSFKSKIIEYLTGLEDVQGLLSPGEKELLQLVREKVLEPEHGFKIEHYAFLAGSEMQSSREVSPAARRKERPRL